VQYGFAGLAAVLLCVNVWMFSQLLEILKRTDSVIADNTATIRQLLVEHGEILRVMRAINERLLSRPCIARFEDGHGHDRTA